MSDIKISLDSSGAGSISIVRVDGVIDTMTAPELEKVMNSLLEQRKYNVIVDLGGVDYISSAGWGIFISNIREIRQNQGDIKLARMIPNVYEIFELLEFDSILRAFESIEKAKSDFDSLPIDIGTEKPIEATQQPPVTPISPEPVPNPATDTGQAVQVNTKEATAKVETAQRPKPKMATEPTSLRDIILNLISKDPFLSISEIKSELRAKHPAFSVGWWKIWGLLRRNKLLRRKKRFRFSRMRLGKDNEYI
jgi:anti-sigma B factor antagonist